MSSPMSNRTTSPLGEISTAPSPCPTSTWWIWRLPFSACANARLLINSTRTRCIQFFRNTLSSLAVAQARPSSSTAINSVDTVFPYGNFAFYLLVKKVHEVLQDIFPKPNQEPPELVIV